MTRRSCIFCGRDDRKITGEHVWPQWIRTLFPEGELTVNYLRHTGDARRWPVKRPDDTGMQLNDVCKGCNEGWMGSLESRVKQLLTPIVQSSFRTHLSETDIKTVASWCCLRAMVYDRVNDKHFSPDQLKAFHDSGGLVPAQTKIWLSAYSKPEPAVAAATDYRVFYDFAMPSERPRPEGYAMTGLVGFLAFQVYTVRFDPSISINVPLRDGPWDVTVLQLWPHTGAVSWPPEMGFDSDTISDFIDRFRTPGMSVRGL
jgi:hypothetical protein